MATRENASRNERQEEPRAPHRGDILVAQPMLHETAFSRSVILLVDVDEPKFPVGCMGVVLNKRIDNLTMRDVIPDWEKGAEIPIFLGGPVDHERLFIIHTLGPRFGKTVEICPNIYIGANLDMVREYIDQGGDITGKLRFFIGYAGWEHGQLEDELKDNVWALTTKIDFHNLLRGRNNHYWRREVEELGAEYRHWLLIPENPEWN